MKKLMIYGLIAMAFLFSSCSKDDPKADVDKLIVTMERYNETFDKLNEDGVISREAPNEDEDSEYDELREIANQYYEGLNNINKKIDKEKTRIEDGKKVNNYEDGYKTAVKEKEAEIEKVTKEFIEKVKMLEEQFFEK